MWVVPGRTAVPSRSASSTSARSKSSSAPSSSSIERRVQSRRSVATWSLRERPVWSRPASGPTLSARADLDVHVDVLEGRVPGRAPGSDVVGERGEAVDEGLDLVRGQETGPAEAADVGDRAGDVVGGERGVDLDRAGEVRDPRVRLAAEPSAPGPHRASGRAEVLMLPGGSVAERRRRRLMLERRKRSLRSGADAGQARVGSGAADSPAGAAARTTARKRPAASSAVRSRCVSASSS